MKKDLVVLFTIFLAVFVVFRQSFTTFFTQDDFILIDYFSQNSIVTNIIHTFGNSQVTHWRPLHNLYFLIFGIIFGKNYFFYHLVTLLIHVLNGFLIFKISKKLKFSFWISFIAGFIYSVHSAHFVTMYWISGSATSIGFLFFLLSFYLMIIGKELISYLFFVLSLLASEAMFAGLPVVTSYAFLIDKKYKRNLIGLLVIGAVVGVFKVWFLINSSVLETYKLSFSSHIFLAVKYYILRILNFAELEGNSVLKILNLIWLTVVSAFILTAGFKKTVIRKVLFSLSIIFFGLFPFVFLPQHLSAHYMNFSVWGFAMLVAISLLRSKPVVRVAVIAVFLAISIVSVFFTEKNHWVVKRARIARQYLMQIERENLPNNSTIVFGNGQISSSWEAYISLGTGKAINFWLKDKNYKTCFSWLEACESVK